MNRVQVSAAQQARARRITARPRGIAVVIVVQILLGVLGIIGGIGSLAAPHLARPQGLGFLQPLAAVFPIVLIVIGAFFLALSYGLWHGYRWAWTLTIVFEIVHIVADVGFVASRSFAIDKIIGLVVIISILIYLTRPQVRAYYGRRG